MANAQAFSRSADPLTWLEKENFISRAELGSVVNWLLGQLNAWEFAKISQGGHTHTEVPLRRVFVDLPVSLRAVSENDEEERVPFLAQLLKAKPIDLRRAKADGKNSERDDEFKGEGFARSDASRMRLTFPMKHDYSAAILIGGPGQGKSTLGQLACQLQRAALLKPFEARLKTSDRELVRSFEADPKRASKDDVSSNTVKYRLFPLQISLPDLSSWISTQEPLRINRDVPIILQFLEALTSSRECSIDAETLSKVVSKLPILLVLDGFDEVGATEDREKLIWAANELLAFLASRNGYAQVLATTRPQGYTGEFARLSIRLAHYYLVPLAKAEALHYAEKLLYEKIANADEREQTLSRIREAAAEPATKRLLTTPLQVTILSALVHQRGRAPRERWNLFSGYFSYTYARETERNTYASGLLRDYKNHIEQIHARVALLLQVEAEGDGGASARMPRERLKEIINAVLTEAGYEEEERDQLVRDIAKAAEERLVFLVEPEPGSFGFEIRSFQEFMCAWALTSGPERFVLDRLRTIARAPMFRNVILFALSRLFSDGSHLRDEMIDEVMPYLDLAKDDIPASATKSGALLALETLEEGAALSYPKWARQLMSIACGLLYLPPSQEHRRLAKVGTPEIRKVLRDVVEVAVLDNSPSKLNELSLWIVLIEALNRNESWATLAANEMWLRMEEPSAMLHALRSVGLSMSAWLRAKILESPERISPDDFIGIRIYRPEGVGTLDWVTFLSEVFDSDRTWKDRISFVDAIKLANPTAQAAATVKNLPAPPKEWMAWCKIAEFELLPSAKNLTLALEALSVENTAIIDAVIWRSSWPLAACIRAARDKHDLIEFADFARKGALGDIADWKAAEQIWRAANLKFDLLPNPNDPPFTADSLQRTPPISVLAWWHLSDIPSARNLPTLRQLNSGFMTAASESMREWYARAALYLYISITRERAVKAISPLAWINCQPAMIGMFIPRPTHMSERVWAEMLDNVSEKEFAIYPSPLDEVIRVIAAGYHHPVLFRLAVSTLQRSAKEKFLESTKSAFIAAIREMPDSHRNINVLLLETYFGILKPKDDLALIKSAFDAKDSDYYLEIVVHVLGQVKNDISVSRRAALLALVVETSTDEPLRGRSIFQLRQLYQQYKSPLINPSVWDALALALPRPLASIVKPRNEFGGSVVAIQEIHIHEIGGVKSLKLLPEIFGADEGQWTVLLGQNGAGKTTILRSICLALRNSDDRGIWPRNSLSLDWLRTNESNLRAEQGGVSLTLTNNLEMSTTIRGGASRSFIRETNVIAASVQVFAYGCRRGSALGGVRRQLDLTLSDGPEIATLFDDAAELIHAETWLISLASAAAQDSNMQKLLNTVLAALSEMLDLQRIEVSDQRVWVNEHGGPRLLLEALSDGYLTSAGWFLDLLARWLEAAQRSGVNISEDFLSRMTGIVLIDEIDLHLHPKWQVEVIKRTRKILPRMTFFVTTHNPMTLVGARAEEIWILSRDDVEIKANRGIDRPILLTGGEIYQEYFGMDDVYPSKIGEELRRYNFLSRFELRTDDENIELGRLARKLDKVGMLPSWVIVDRKVGA